MLRPAMPLLAATVLILGAAQVRAEDPADEAEDAFWSCVKDFARSLAANSPLETDAITDQSLRSCSAARENHKRALTEPSEGLSPDQVEARLLVSRELARSVAGSLVDSLRSDRPVARHPSEIPPGPESYLDGGIWMNPGMTEEQTADAWRPRVVLPASSDPRHQP